ncbi:recombinase family protein [Nocardia sp. NBC_01009]|uniref:recombinase family protein n=1 Tax=Nocardia sp. NBC_01009 TaxID=2975996 RepID=UPI003868BAD3
MATATCDLDIPAPLTPDGDRLDPVGGAGALISYGRVSTKDQNLDRQIQALTAAGCQRIFTDKKSGKNAERVTRVLFGPRDQAIRHIRCFAPLLPDPQHLPGSARDAEPAADETCADCSAAKPTPYCRAMCMRISLWMSVISSPERSTVTECSVPVNREGGS